MYEKNKFLNLSDREYHSLDIMSYHQLKDFALSSSHWESNRKNKKVSAAMNFGSAAHRFLLTPSDKDKIIVKPKVDLRRTEDKKILADFLASVTKDDICISEDELLDLQEMEKKLIARTEFFETMLDARHIEQACIVDVNLSDLIEIEEDCVVTFKFKPDVITKNGIICDYKTTQCAADSVFSDEIKRRKYSAQLSFYSYLYAKITGEQLKDHAVNIAQESNAPFEPNFFTIDPDRMEHGFNFVKFCLYKYYKFLKSDKKISGYAPGFKQASYRIDEY